MILTAATIEDYKQHTEQRISTKAEYRIGNTWYQTTIERKERMKDGRVAVYVPIVPHSDSTVVITAVRLYNDYTGGIWAEKNGLSISVTGRNRSISYRFTFDIKENEIL